MEIDFKPKSMSRGQAMIFDALFFLMICGLASSILLWGTTTYGHKSYEAYRYLYLNDYQTSALEALSGMEYKVDGVTRIWLDELGLYMENATIGEAREKALFDYWGKICVQAPSALLLSVYSDTSGTVRGTKDEPLYFSCSNLLSRNESTGKDENDCDTYSSLWDADQNCEYFINKLKYPYYASPTESKACHNLRCQMEIRTFY